MINYLLWLFFVDVFFLHKVDFFDGYYQMFVKSKSGQNQGFSLEDQFVCLAGTFWLFKQS